MAAGSRGWGVRVGRGVMPWGGGVGSEKGAEMSAEPQLLVPPRGFAGRGGETSGSGGLS